MSSSRAANALTIAVVCLPVLFGLAHAHSGHTHGSHAPKAAYGEPGDPAKPSREVVVVMAESSGRMLFAPDTIEVRKGEQVRFRFRNEGALEHEFLIATQAELDEHADLMQAMPDMKHEDPNAIRLAPQASGDLVWRFTTAGEFPFACLIPGHREAGMVGKVIVR
ncbi:MAG: cupredoxin family protein [Hyphomicrobiaceae bacterium]|nr:cupredoxin family protein [Hyphomicrobiaceae bacterium]